MLVNVAFPASATMFFSMLMELVNFQILDLSQFYNRILMLDPDSDGNSPLNEQFERMGY